MREGRVRERSGGRRNYRGTEEGTSFLSDGGDTGTGSHLLEVAQRLGYAHIIAQPTT